MPATAALTSLELFAGAGGLALGLHRAGFRPLLVVERDPAAIATLRANAGCGGAADGWPLDPSDVRFLDFRPFAGRLDLVSGGPPCQPFSLGGRHAAHTDERDMFPQAVRALREVRPRAFVFENVKGLLRAAFADYFEHIRLQMEHPELTSRAGEPWTAHLARLRRHHASGCRAGLHYRVATKLVNAADHGVPQRRERVVFIGFRDDLAVDWEFPARSHSADALRRDQAPGGTYWDRHPVPRREQLAVTAPGGEADDTLPWRTVRDALTGLPDPDPKRHARAAAAAGFAHHTFQPGARTYPGHTGSPMDAPAKTLKAGVHGVPGGENMLRRADGTVRYFTVRESARLQTFPDTHVFPGSWTETMRQLGNAVPVALAEAVGAAVAARLRAR